jgi:RNase P/RNase MRP subunit POP5
VGILGWTKAIPQFLENKEGVILAVERKALNDIRAAFALSKEKIKVKRVSGTIKGLSK